MLKRFLSAQAAVPSLAMMACVIALASGCAGGTTASLNTQQLYVDISANRAACAGMAGPSQTCPLVREAPSAAELEARPFLPAASYMISGFTPDEGTSYRILINRTERQQNTTVQIADGGPSYDYYLISVLDSRAQ